MRDDHPLSNRVRGVKTWDVLSLFSGIGGIDLGLERSGYFRTVAFCEIDAKARAVLSKHWPNVRQYHDVRELTADRLRADGIIPRFVAAGFPCQDISAAGPGGGLGGARSGLYFDCARLIGEIRPDGVLLENVSILRSRGLDVVLGTLAALGYRVEWHCIPASAIGAPHQRDRIWIVAYAMREGLQGHRAEHGLPEVGAEIEAGGRRHDPLSNATGVGPQGQGEPVQPVYPAAAVIGQAIKSFDGRFAGQWAVEPDVGRVANGVPGRVDRLKQLGNAVVPQIPELIGRAFGKVFQ